MRFSFLKTGTTRPTFHDDEKETVVIDMLKILAICAATAGFDSFSSCSDILSVTPVTGEISAATALVTSSTVIGCSAKYAEELLHCSSHAVTEENVDVIFATVVTQQLFYCVCSDFTYGGR